MAPDPGVGTDRPWRPKAETRRAEWIAGRGVPGPRGRPRRPKGRSFPGLRGDRPWRPKTGDKRRPSADRPWRPGVVPIVRRKSLREAAGGDEEAVIAHVVLFRPEPNLSQTTPTRLIAAFEQALAGIPTIRRSHVGRRVRIGRAVRTADALGLPVRGGSRIRRSRRLREYLDHPAHDEVGAAVFAAAADILVYDFEMGRVGRAPARRRGLNSADKAGPANARSQVPRVGRARRETTETTVTPKPVTPAGTDRRRLATQGWVRPSNRRRHRGRFRDDHR